MSKFARDGGDDGDDGDDGEDDERKLAPEDF